MKCNISFKDISFYIDGAYNHKKREALKAHFAKCPLCKKSLEQAMSLKASLSALVKLEPSDGFDFEFNRLLNERTAIHHQGLAASIRKQVSGFVDTVLVPIPVSIRTAASLILMISLFMGIRAQVMSKMPLVEFSAGNARIYRQSSNKWIMPRPQLRLRPGDKIQLMDGAILNLVSRGKYKARIKDNSLVVVSRLETGLRNINTDFSISHGKLLVNTTDKFRGSGMRVYTPACDAEIVGTAFMVEVSENNTWLGVLEGRVRILSKPHPLKPDTQRPIESYVSAGQKAFTMLYSQTTIPQLLTSREWQSALELYQLVEDPQIMLIMGTGADRVEDLLNKPALLYIPESMGRIMPKRLQECLYSIAESAKTGDIDSVKAKTIDLENLLVLYPNPLYNTEILMFMASHFYYAKDYDAALSALNKVVELYPESEMASLAQSSMAYIYKDNLKNIKKAREIYKALVKTYPNSPDAIRAQEILSSQR
jgi:hypothetical protein